MSGTPILRDFRWWGAAGVLSLAVAGFITGLPGVGGMGLGLGSALFGVFGIRLAIGLLESASAGGRPGGFGVLVSTLGFAAKIPLYVVCGWLAQRMGNSAFGCFLAGIVLVYSATVVWAAAAPATQPKSPNGSPAD